MTDQRADDRPAAESSVGVRPVDPFAEGVDRRRLLASSATVGATVSLSGCLSDSAGERERVPTVFAFNNGDRTVSVIDAEADEHLETAFIDTTASFPANQYGTSADSEYDVCWLNVDGGIRAVDQHTLEEVAAVETGYGPNYPNLTPGEDQLVVAAGGTTTLDPDEPETHSIVRVDADRSNDEFGTVTGEIETEYTGPCDATLGPDGEYAFVPEIANETLAVVSLDPFEIVARIDAGEPVGEGKVLPFMATASFDGDRLLVENGEGELGPDPDIPREGSESIWDVSDPEEPVERERITRDDGLSAAPITSEIGPDGETGYLFTPDAEAVTVLDVEDATVERELDVGGRSISGAWGPNREKLYVPVQTANHVAVIDHADGEVVATIEAGESPTGAVAGMTRPDTDATRRLLGSLSALGIEVGDREMTHCPPDNCYCG